MEFEVDTAFLENEAKLDFQVSGPSRTEINVDAKPSDQSHLVTFVPHDAGIYALRVIYNDVEVDGSPFTISVADNPNYSRPPGDASKCVASGMGLRNCVGGQKALFEVDTSQAGFGQLTVKMTGPGHAKITSLPPPDVLSRKDDVSKVPSKFEYVVQEPGDYILNVCWSEMHVPGSPFSVIARRDGKRKVEDKVEQCLEDAKRVIVPSCAGLRSGVSKQWNSFFVDARQAGDGAVAVSVQGPTRCEIELRKQAQDSYSIPGLGALATNSQSGLVEVKYFPDSSGKFVMQVTFNGIQVPGSPFTVTVT